MTNFEIITQIEDLARDAKGRIDPEDPEDVFRKDHEALTEAAEILKGEKKKMDEYIKREDALSCVLGVFDRQRIREIPAADVAPIKHGKWVRQVYVDPQGGEWTKWECSLCGRIEVLKEPYCSCGAKMDLEE